MSPKPTSTAPDVHLQLVDRPPLRPAGPHPCIVRLWTLRLFAAPALMLFTTARIVHNRHASCAKAARVRQRRRCTPPRHRVSPLRPTAVSFAMTDSQNTASPAHSSTWLTRARQRASPSSMNSRGPWSCCAGRGHFFTPRCSSTCWRTSEKSSGRPWGRGALIGVVHVREVHPRLPPHPRYVSMAQASFVDVGEVEDC